MIVCRDRRLVTCWRSICCNAHIQSIAPMHSGGALFPAFAVGVTVKGIFMNAVKRADFGHGEHTRSVVTRDGSPIRARFFAGSGGQKTSSMSCEAERNALNVRT